ncbi:MAG: sulfatase [Candidatus Eisenbacteria bacterium]|uniref:Sulfatase n=1 Tax=Eiseniibacteriota bacterium TaxID=2212470 RepID=A0A956NJ15_UNCEI|nr:sulfatase [Candidatus Eisenbacteria bacterium]
MSDVTEVTQHAALHLRPDAIGRVRHRFLLAGAVSLICASLGTGCDEGTPEPPVPPNVVLITIESLRSDTVPGTRGGIPVSPAFESIAEEAAVFTDAHAVTSWTLASHASLFTGLYPTSHAATQPLSRLGDSYATMAEILGDRGYQCAGIVSGPYLRAEYNLSQGFEHYDEELATSLSARTDESGVTPAAHRDVTSPGMLEKLTRFLTEGRDPERPFFLFAYFWDPHYDYIPPSPYDTLFVGPECVPVDLSQYEASTLGENGIAPGQGGIASGQGGTAPGQGGIEPRQGASGQGGIAPGELAYVLSQYYGEIRWTDWHLGRLAALLETEGLWESSLVIVTSDHGEEFFDHGNKGHKKGLYGETVQVPLVVKFPKGAHGNADWMTGVQDRLVSLVDVLPTVLDVTGTESPDPLPGRSLLAPPRTAEEPIFYELDSVHYAVGDPTLSQRTSEKWYGIREGGHKLIAVPSARRVELYDVVADPGETENLAQREASTARSLMVHMTDGFQVMANLGQLYVAGGEAELSPEAKEQLRSLGYIR